MDTTFLLGLVGGGVAGRLLAPKDKTAGTMIGSAVGGILGFAISKQFKLPASTPAAATAPTAQVVIPATMVPMVPGVPVSGWDY